VLGTAPYLEWLDPTDGESKTLLWLVFAQALAIQLVGNYFW
jgi:hypothetical protein